MAIITGAGIKFMEELPLGIHTLAEGAPSDTIKVAAYGPNAVLGPNISTYVTNGEISGGGYTAGGVAVPLIIVGASGSARGGGAQFQDTPYIAPTTDTFIDCAGVGVRGIMLYNETTFNRNIFTLDFGETVAPVAGITMKWAVGDIVNIQDILIPLLGKQI